MMSNMKPVRMTAVDSMLLREVDFYVGNVGYVG